MIRLLTAAVAVPLALGAVFFLPARGFFLAAIAVMLLATREYIGLIRRSAAEGPYRALYLFVPLASVALVEEIRLPGIAGQEAWIAVFSVSVVMSIIVLLSRVPLEQAAAVVGFLAFGTAYLSLPVASLYYLQQLDPWVVLLLFAIVWLGDAAAYYVGSSIGRRKLAPRVSPNKTWEGCCASVAAAVVATGIWSFWQLGSLSWLWLCIGLGTSIAAQLGDLVESMIKRGAGVKDSGTLFPGHGGVLDRLDALLFSAPVLTLLLLILGQRVPLP